MAQTVLITLTLAGVDVGPFDLYSDADGYVSAFETGVSRAALIAGYTSNLVPDAATTIKAQSYGTCTNSLYLVIEGGTTTTTTTSTSTSTTTSTTTAAVPSIQLGNALCRTVGSCNDNATCGVSYGITVSNAPVGSYVTLTTNPPSSTATVTITDSNPNTATLTYSEPDAVAIMVDFTLELRNVSNVIIASSGSTLDHQSYWQFLSVC
jgi:hypothetical protein